MHNRSFFFLFFPFVSCINICPIFVQFLFGKAIVFGYMSYDDHTHCKYLRERSPDDFLVTFGIKLTQTSLFRVLILDKHNTQ